MIKKRKEKERPITSLTAESRKLSMGANTMVEALKLFTMPCSGTVVEERTLAGAIAETVCPPLVDTFSDEAASETANEHAGSDGHAISVENSRDTVAIVGTVVSNCDGSRKVELE